MLGLIPHNLKKKKYLFIYKHFSKPKEYSNIQMSKLPDRVQLHISHTPLRVDKMANHYLKPLLPLKAFNQLISQSFSYLFTEIEELKKLALFFSCFHSPFSIFNQTWFTN